MSLSDLQAENARLRSEAATNEAALLSLEQNFNDLSTQHSLQQANLARLAAEKIDLVESVDNLKPELDAARAREAAADARAAREAAVARVASEERDAQATIADLRQRECDRLADECAARAAALDAAAARERAAAADAAAARAEVRPLALASERLTAEVALLEKSRAALTSELAAANEALAEARGAGAARAAETAVALEGSRAEAAALRVRLAAAEGDAASARRDASATTAAAAAEKDELVRRCDALSREVTGHERCVSLSLDHARAPPTPDPSSLTPRALGRGWGGEGVALSRRTSVQSACALTPLYLPTHARHAVPSPPLPLPLPQTPRRARGCRARVSRPRRRARIEL
jgi:hypothetical protein